MRVLPLINPQTLFTTMSLGKRVFLQNKRTTFLSLTFGGILGMGNVLFLPKPVPHLRVPLTIAPIIKVERSHPVAKPHREALPAVPAIPVTETVHNIGQVSVEGLVGNGIEMHSTMQTYTTLFSGNVTCGSHLCNAGKVVIELDSEHAPELKQEVDVQTDGRFAATISLQELPDQQVDWKIIATGPDSRNQQVVGRFILSSEETIYSITQPLSL